MTMIRNNFKAEGAKQKAFDLRPKNNKGFLFSSFCFYFAITTALAQAPGRNNQPLDGYRGIWFTLNQLSAYGDKYSGGLGTYTAHHIPMAIYAPEVNKTFFVYGGTTGESDRYLLCMIGSFDHADSTVSRPVVVHDKGGVDDPHDNPSILLDDRGYIWVFVSGRNTRRMGYKYRSTKPYSIESFEQITEEVMTYPQPWFTKGKGYFHFFTKYTGERELYFETSKDGKNWSADAKLAGIKRSEDTKSGHYQVSNTMGNKIVTFFNWHPNGNVDQRTNIYYLQTSDFGATWKTVYKKEIAVPVQEAASESLVIAYHRAKNVYLCDVSFDKDQNPVCLYLTSNGHEPGPQNGKREWHVLRWTGKVWDDRIVFTSDHNYDMGSLVISDRWRIIAPSDDGPQVHGSGGEIVMWESDDSGKTWKRAVQLTHNSERNHNYVRRVVNGRSPFLYFWSDGNPEKISISRIYAGDEKGAVWQLPYTMKEDREKLLSLKKD
jgi:hypothetical protein